MIYTEITPNPASLKFVVNKLLLPVGSVAYESPEEAEGQSLLAMQLFQFEFVTGVFISQNFVTITKKEGYTWEGIIPLVKDAIKEFLSTGQPIVNKMPEREEGNIEEQDETVGKIKQILEQNIRPAVAMDGGDVVFDSFEEGIVKLKLQGSCSGCPSSTMTLKVGIERLLKQMVPGVEEVQAANA